MASKYISNEVMSAIVLKCGSLTGFAEAMNMPYDTLYSKFAGRSDWKVDEAVQAAQVLGMDLNEFSNLIMKVQ